MNAEDVWENAQTVWLGLFPQLLFTHVFHSGRFSRGDASSWKGGGAECSIGRTKSKANYGNRCAFFGPRRE